MEATDNKGKELSPFPVPHASTPDRSMLVNISVQLIAHESLGLCCVEQNRSASGHTYSTSGINSFFFFFGNDLMGPPLVELNITWCGRQVL